MRPAWIRVAAGAVTIEVVARPGAPRRGVLRIDARGPVIGVHSAAERGKANDEIVAVVAKMAGVPRARVEIVRGASSRRKVLKISTPQPELVANALESALAVSPEQCQSEAKEPRNQAPSR